MRFWTFLISMMPVGELRFSVPFGIFAGLHWTEALIFSLIGNSLIALILIYTINYFTIDTITIFLEKIPLIGKIFKKWHNKAIEKSKKINNWSYTGLALFVSIPLPITGAWTALLIASFLNLKPFKSFIYITIGLFVSGTIITIICVNFSNLMEYIFINKEQIKIFIDSLS